MHIVAFMSIGIPLMAYIPVHGMIEKLHNYYPGLHYDIVNILGIDLNLMMHNYGDGQRRTEKPQG